MIKTRAAFLVLAGMALLGCDRTLLDPNDPRNASKVSAEQLQIGIRNAYERTRDWVETKKISAEEGDRRFQAYVDLVVQNLDTTKLVEEDMWRYGDIYRTAKRWDLAELTLEIASRDAETEDRRVNDTLRYAEALAHNKKVTEAVRVARKVFNTDHINKAPILLAVYLEIVPAGRGKGHDLELAKLIRDAVEQHKQTMVDPTTEPGRMFLMARPSHIRNALRLANELAAGTFGKDVGVQA
ncbi:MAG: hypothetical protein JNJ45_07905 [Chthonomonas sp.]|nr:hypothetical protein [Chthonomonas sp.]